MNKCNMPAASSPRAGQALALLAIAAAEQRGQKDRQEQEHGDTCSKIVLKSSCAARGQPGVPVGDGTDSSPGG